MFFIQVIFLILVISFSSAKLTLADWTSDLTGPSCSISFTSGATATTSAAVGSLVNVTVTTNDVGGIGLKQFTVYKNGSAVYTSQINSSPYPWDTRSEAAVPYIFTAQAEDKAGNPGSTCSGTFTLIAPTLSVSCNVDKTSIVSGSSVTYTARVSGGINSYTYRFNGTVNARYDISQTEKQLTTPLYSTSTNDITKNESVTIISGTQEKTAACPIVNVYPVLSTSCTVDKTAAAPSETVTWRTNTSGGTGGYAYTWTQDAAGTSSQPTASRTYTNTEAGTTRYAAVRVTSGIQSANPVCPSVYIQPALGVTCSPSAATAKTNENITWTAVPSGGAGANSYSFRWTGTDGLPSGSQSSVSKTYSSAGSKYASVTVSSGNHQPVTVDCGRVDVTDILRASCSGSPNPAAIYQNVNWTSSASGGSGSKTYSWNTTDGKSGTSANLSTSYTSSGRKVASLAVRSSDGQTASAECQVNIQPPPPLFTMNNPTSSCDGNSNPYVHLSWSTSQGAQNYVLYKFQYKWLGSYWGWDFRGVTYLPADTNNYPDQDVIRDTIYGYWMMAVSPYGESYTQFKTVTAASCNPEPFNFTSISSSCFAVNQGYVSLSWSPSQYATSYTILRYNWLTGEWRSFTPGTEVFPENFGAAYKPYDPFPSRVRGPGALGPRSIRTQLLNYTDFTVVPTDFYYYYYVIAQNQWGVKSYWRGIATKNCTTPAPDLKVNGSDGPITVPDNTIATVDVSMRNADSCAASTLPAGFDNRFTNNYSLTNLAYVFSSPGYRTPSLTGPNSYTYQFSCTNSNIGQTRSDQVVINVSPPQIPDLVAQNLSVAGPEPNKLVQGQTLTLTAKIKNIGNTQAAASTTRLLINVNRGGTANEVTTQPTQALSPNGEQTVSTSWPNAVPGDHTFQVCADINNNVAEGVNENNNCTTYDFTVSYQPPSITSCGPNPSTVIVNNPVSWSGVVIGGKQPYTYVWNNGTDGVRGNTNPLNLVNGYSREGNKIITFTVRADDGQTASLGCSFLTVNPQSPPFIQTEGGDVHSNVKIQQASPAP